MSELKKVIISIPDNLLKEVDQLISLEKMNRSQFTREAIKFYIKEKRKLEIRDQLKRGYQEMSEMNLEFANTHFETDENQLSKYEKRLKELN